MKEMEREIHARLPVLSLSILDTLRTDMLNILFRFDTSDTGCWIINSLHIVLPLHILQDHSGNLEVSSRPLNSHVLQLHK